MLSERDDTTPKGAKRSEDEALLRRLRTMRWPTPDSEARERILEELERTLAERRAAEGDA